MAIRSRVGMSFVAASLLSLAAISHGEQLDSGIYTLYDFGPDYKSLIINNYEITLAPFGHIGSILEGYPTVLGDTVSRNLYIVDVAAGTTGDEVQLFIYKKSDTIEGGSVSTTVTLTRRLTLPLTGGSKAVSFMAANKGFVFVGTDQHGQAVRITKGSFDIELVADLYEAMVTSITADDHGYVEVRMLHSFFKKTPSFQFDPNGKIVNIGGGSFLLSSTTSLSSLNFPPAGSDSPPPTPPATP